MPRPPRRPQHPEWWIAQCHMCAGGYYATDAELENSLRHLHNRLTGVVEEENLSAVVEMIALRVARGESHRRGVPVDDLRCDESLDACTVFTRCWPWRLPLGEETGREILDGPHWTELAGVFEPADFPF